MAASADAPPTHRRARAPLTLVLIVLVFFAGAFGGVAADTSAAMNNARLGALIERLGVETVGGAGQWRLVVDGRAVMVLTDEDNNRMRIMGHVTAAEALDEETIVRLMQANFDSTLDARYAIARNTLWSVFLHPLESLTERDFLLGLGQVVNLANSYGTTYSSGLLLFGGGDSAELQKKELLDYLLEKGLAI